MALAGGGSGSSAGGTTTETAPAGSVTSSSPMADSTTITGRNTINENPSSLPSTSGAGLAGFSFPYFSLYTIDQYNGVVLYPNQYQQAMLGGSVSLVAQIAAGSSSSYTYSWTTSGTAFTMRYRREHGQSPIHLDRDQPDRAGGHRYPDRHQCQQPAGEPDV